MSTRRSWEPKAAAGRLTARSASFQAASSRKAATGARAVLRGADPLLSARMRCLAFKIDQSVFVQPTPRVLRVLGEPFRGTAQSKAVAPFVHITAHPLPPDILERCRQQNLQIAYRALLRIVAARIRVQAGATLRGHADEMRALVQHRMQRRIKARVNPRADQAGLALSPERPGNLL